MTTKHDEEIQPQDDHDWQSNDERIRVPEPGHEFLADADEHVPDEAGYGHGV